MDRELREQSNRNSTFFCKCLKDYEWDVAYPLIDCNDTNRSIVIDEERFWGKL